MIRLLAVALVLLVGQRTLAQPLNGNLLMNFLNASPTSVQSGGSTTLSWTVSSIGIAGGRGQVSSYTVQIDSMSPTSFQQLVTIPNGTTSGTFNRSIQLPAVASATSFQITVRIFGDSGFNQNDNSASVFVTVSPPPTPDLRCWTPSGWTSSLIASGTMNATTGTSTFAFGQTVLVSYGVINDGGITPAGVPMQLLLDGVSIPVPGPYAPMGTGIAFARMERNIAMPSGIAPGNHRLILRIDADNLVPETNNSNNECSFDFFVADPPRPNLAFDPPGGRQDFGVIVSNHPNAAATAATMNQGDTAYISVQYNNTGTVPCAAFNFNARIGSTIVGAFRDPGLGANQTVTRTDVFVIQNISAGSVSFQVSLDANSEITESNEGDNVKVVVVPVAAVVCPAIQTQPANQSTCATGSAVFATTATGSSPLAYQWQQLIASAWTPLTNGTSTGLGMVSGATTQSLSISPLPVATGVMFRCSVSNQCGITNTFSATLFVCFADFNCQAGITVADIFDFLEAWFAGSPAADINGDGDNIQDIFDFLGAWFSGC